MEPPEDSSCGPTLPASMPWSRALSPVEQAWLDCALEMSAAARRALVGLAGREPGRRVLGRGAGGDSTVELDQVAEDAIRAVLAQRAPGRFRLISEEVGIIEGPPSDDDGPLWRVVVDPVDGSLNAKRGLAPYSTLVAIAEGDRMADVVVAHVQDHTRRSAFAAVKGAGFWAHDPVDPPPGGSGIELVLLELGRPDRYAFGVAALAELGSRGGAGVRIRQVGSLGLALCYVATGAADLLLSPSPSRSLDIAAGLLVVGESGGGAAALDGTDLATGPLDLQRRAPFVAWRAGLDGDAIATQARRLLGL